MSDNFKEGQTTSKSKLVLAALFGCAITQLANHQFGGSQELSATDKAVELYQTDEPEDVWDDIYLPLELDEFQDNMTKLCPWVEVWTNPAGP